MAGDLTEQVLRAQRWLAGQRWKVRKSLDFRPRSDVQMVERILPDVPRELLRGLVEYLQGVATETNPQIEGVPYFGTWIYSRHSWEREQPPDDNTLTFVQTLVAGVGVTAGFVVENGCAVIVTQTFYWDVTTLPTVTAGTSGIEYQLSGVSRDRDTGLYSAVLEKREQVTQTIAQYVTEEGAAERTLEQVFISVRTDDKDHTGAAVALQSMTLEAGKIKRRTRKKNKNCTQDIEEQDRRSVNQTATNGEARADQTSETLLATQAAAEVTATPVVGKIVRARNRPTEFGKVATELETITPVDQEATLGEDRHDQSSTRTTHTQADAAVTAPPTATAGTIKRVQNRPTEFGKFATEAETITAKNQTATDGETRSDQTSVTTKATQADTAASAARGTGEDNKVIRVRNRPTEFGKVATEREVITPVAIHSYASYKTNSGSQPGTLTTYYWRNQAAGWGDGLMDAASDNAHKSMSPPVINEFGLEDGSASIFLPDTTVAQTPDTIHVGLITTPLVQQRVKDIVASDGTITGTQVQDVTYIEYTKYVATSDAAEDAIEDMATAAGDAGGALAERSIRPFTTNGGLRMYIAEAKTTPLTYSAWTEAPEPT